MDWKLWAGLALMAPALLAGVVALVNWARQHPKEFFESMITALMFLVIIAAIVGVCMIAAIWWPWWALPAGLAVLAFLAGFAAA